MNLRLLTASLFFASGFAGCGLVADKFEADLKVDFEVNGTGQTYKNELSVDPSTYQDVRDNCSSIDKATGQIRGLTIEITQVNDTHNAQFGSGEVYMRQGGAGAAEWPPESAANAFASFDRIPLVTGQVVSLELTPSRRAALAALVFTENCDKTVDVKLVGNTDGDATSFKGKISFQVEFIAGI